MNNNLAVWLTLILLACVLLGVGAGAVVGGMANNHAWLFIGGVACCWAGRCVVAVTQKVNL